MKPISKLAAVIATGAAAAALRRHQAPARSIASCVVPVWRITGFR